MLEDLKKLIVAYARQELVTPLQQLGKTIKFGILGALSLGIGVVFLALGSLRLIQTEAAGVFDGNLSPLPYVVVLVGLLIASGALLLGRQLIANRSQKAKGEN